jgi:hypothetical protein
MQNVSVGHPCASTLAPAADPVAAPQGHLGAGDSFVGTYPTTAAATASVQQAVAYYKAHAFLGTPVFFSRQVTAERFRDLAHALIVGPSFERDWNAILAPLALDPNVAFTSTRHFWQDLLDFNWPAVRSQTQGREQLGLLLTWARALVTVSLTERHNPNVVGPATATCVLLTDARRHFGAASSIGPRWQQREIDRLLKQLQRRMGIHPTRWCWPQR